MALSNAVHTMQQGVPQNVNTKRDCANALLLSDTDNLLGVIGVDSKLERAGHGELGD